MSNPSLRRSLGLEWMACTAALKTLLGESEGRRMTAEEDDSWDRLVKSRDRLRAQLDFLDKSEDDDRRAALRDAPGLTRELAAEARLVRQFLTAAVDGQRRRLVPRLTVPVSRAAKEAQLIAEGADPLEVRALLWDTGSVGSTVPTTMARAVYGAMEANMAMWQMPTTKLDTESGEPLQVPKFATNSIATQIAAQGTAYGGTDPVFGRMTLDAFRYGQLVVMSNEVVQDAGIDILEYLGRNLGRAIGRVVGADLVIGSGTGEPNGVMTAISGNGAGSVTTGGSLLTPSYESLVDLAWTVNSGYRSDPAASWLMRDATLANIRKLRDGAGGTTGAPIFQPAMVPGQRDMILGWPVWTDPSVASLASNARIVAFGDFSQYFVRHVGDIELAVDGHQRFPTDDVQVRSKWRVDGDLLFQDAIASLVQNV